MGYRLKTTASQAVTMHVYALVDGDYIGSMALASEWMLRELYVVGGLVWFACPVG